MQTKAKIEADLEQEGLRRLYLSFKQEEDYNKRWIKNLIIKFLRYLSWIALLSKLNKYHASLK